MNLADAFARTATIHAEKIAIFWGDEEWAYRRVAGQAGAVAAELGGRWGIRPGDRVGLWLKNGPEFVVALFGVLGAGGVATPINNFLKPDEVIQILADASIDLLIFDDSLSEGVERLRAERPSLRAWNINEFPSAETGGGLTASGRTEEDLAILIYTSGTTGRPKGVMLSHGNLLHNVESCRLVLEAEGSDRIVLLLPMFHSFMLTVSILLPMLVGGSIVLIKSVHPPKNIIQEVIHRQATILPGVPQFFRMFSHIPLPPELPLRVCISGGAPLPAEILREFNARFSIPLLEGYGLSEASPVVSFNPIRGPWKAGSIGVPVSSVEMSIQDDAGKILEPGETGEVCVRGGNVMRGYWNAPAETARTFRDGWLLTGDVGHRDTEGYFFITDRKKDMLLVNGINVYPREIEEVIYRFPGVKEASVVGVPDARRGEQPVAFVAAHEGVTLAERDLLHFVREKLADYKIPKHVVFVPALPRNATGKVLKTALKEKWASGASRPEA